LKKISTNENLSEPQPLPNSWKNIFGLEGCIDRLGDLSWAGHPDMGWFEMSVEEPKINIKELVDNQIKSILKDTAPMVAVDNLNITKGGRAAWVDYRRLIQEIYLQPGYPDNVFWPAKPNV
jgi:hypothetical protein